MKPLPLLVATTLVAALVLAPMSVAAGSITFSSPAAGASYKGVASYSIAGAVSPIPSQADNVFITVKNPSGVTVDAASVSVAATTGTFTYSTATGGSGNWKSGTYTISATDSFGATGTATFTYTASGAPTPVTGISVQALASTPVFAGQTVQVTALVSYSNGTLATASWTGSHYHTPAGAANALTAPTSIGSGMYMWTITLPSSAANGLYSVHLKANVSGNIAWGVAGFTVNSALMPSNNAVLQNDLKNNFSALTSSLTSLSSAVSGLSSTLSSVSSTVSSLNTAVSGLSSAMTSVQSAVGGLGTTLSNIQTTLGNVNTNVNNLSGLSGNLQSATSGINTTQTYVLVVAVLAAITLVLELAILVRKLS